MSKKAFLFDMDGTMIDNMWYHFKAWEKMMLELGGGLTGEALIPHLYGKPPELLTRVYGSGKFTLDEMNEIGARKEGYYREMYEPYVKLLPGLADFLRAARDRNIRLGVGTASNIPNIDMVLQKTGIAEYFSSVVSADDVERSKPDPETWLKGARELGVLPADCIVFEDVPKGVEAASRAGMSCVVLTTNHTSEEFEDFDNIITIVPDFTALDIDKLAGF
ncbi:HAD family hydrolase [Flavihumibacter stibioxidans]|uniref:Beta-phosphoglucomutase n=1 Tax=Flavihumibacter stibioxidans TaxID=1834163 RepID=A0ABR7M7H5_9BACT|nr:HAD family phosphatase [Flavihumibacter stibioxidans]MBC6490871.1 haloacid dehalogenase [Flavihumibacter stibioxidans]